MAFCLSAATRPLSAVRAFTTTSRVLSQTHLSRSSENVLRTRKWPLLGALGIAVGMGYYTSVLLAPPKALACCERNHGVPTGRPTPASNMSACDFDHSLDSTESWSGILKLRQKMSEQATGNVLEVAVGTGRNFSYYDWATLVPKTPLDVLRARSRRILSYTGIDISPEMLEVADEKLHQAVPITDSMKAAVGVCHGERAGQAAGFLQYYDSQVRIVKSDVQQFIPKPARAETYDTVVQTFGLCSVSQPETVLKNIASVTTPETGKIILLEHGTGSYGFVNSLLDKSAPGHFEKYGCWWNRDIEGIVRKAASEVPGLEVVKVEKPWFQLGTLYWIELKVTSCKI